MFTEKNKSLESSVSCIVDTEDASVRENAVKLLMSAGGVAGHFRETVWRKCVELLDQINLERFFFVSYRDLQQFEAVRAHCSFIILVLKIFAMSCCLTFQLSFPFKLQRCY